MANDWLSKYDKEMRKKFMALPDERKGKLAAVCNGFAALMNRADLSSFESEIAAWMSYSAISLANEGYVKAGYAEFNELPIVSQMQKVLFAMTDEQLDEMQAAIIANSDPAAAEAFKFMMATIREHKKKKVVDKAKAG